MNAQTEEEPAVAVLFVKGNSDALVIVIGNDEVLLCFCIFFEVSNDLFTVFAEILFGNLYPDLTALDRLLEFGDNAVKSFSLIAELCSFYNELGNKISTVVKEVVFLHGCMT